MNLEYLPKRRTRPARVIMSNCFNNIRPILKKAGITFSIEMVGSTKRNLVLISTDPSNEPKHLFDLDYNVHIHQRGSLSKKDSVKKFKDELNKLMMNNQFTLEDSSKKALKFYPTDENDSNWSYEIVVFVKKEDEKNNFYVFNRKSWTLELEKRYDRPLAALRNIKEWGLRNELRDKYKTIRENNSVIGRKNYEMFFEAVNNVVTDYSNNSTSQK
jgi:hypothetical protein